MAPLAAVAISIASKYIPELIGAALDSKKASAVTQHVVEAVKTYTGMSVDTEQDCELALESAGPAFWLKQREQILKLVELELSDVQDAREKTNDILNTKLSLLVMYVNPVLIVIGISALVYVTLQLELNGGLLATISAVLGGWLNQLYQERQQVMNFHFGSSMGSKLKQR